ncbi:GNAT family N-acetyltransferase [Polymorphospora rubra]|uniref:GNAT family N-acetyltransferase n=1 Tax=Polymorphospora rubra TaxID=338584 RepID=UPI0033FAF93B
MASEDRPPLSVQIFGVSQLDIVKGELLSVYEQVYSKELADPFFSTSRYWDRVCGYASRPGFSIAVGRIDENMAGYALGYTLPTDSRWWSGLVTPVDDALLREDGKRTFALNEIMVLPEFRRRGYARAIHDALLRPRAEERATLLVLPDNVPAQAAYASWGWRRIGALKPFDDSPTYDSMLLLLRHQGRKS